MKFLIVGDRGPGTYSVCAHCAKPIDVGYLRELRSNLLYCDYACYQRRELKFDPWPLAGFDNFIFVNLQLAENLQRVLLDTQANWRGVLMLSIPPDRRPLRCTSLRPFVGLFAREKRSPNEYASELPCRRCPNCRFLRRFRRSRPTLTFQHVSHLGLSRGRFTTSVEFGLD